MLRFILMRQSKCQRMRDFILWVAVVPVCWRPVLAWVKNNQQVSSSRIGQKIWGGVYLNAASLINESGTTNRIAAVVNWLLYDMWLFRCGRHCVCTGNPWGQHAFTLVRTHTHTGPVIHARFSWAKCRSPLVALHSTNSTGPLADVCSLCQLGCRLD